MSAPAEPVAPSGLGAIEALLEEAIGLDSATVGRATVERAVRRRLEACGLPEAGAYLARLRRDPGELQALVDEVTVLETWFFRDRRPFELLRELVRRRWWPPRPQRPLRVLSLPCATGEEAYSIAMVLHELGYGPGTLQLEAVDVNVRALAVARRGCYGEKSFRGDEEGYRARYFRRTAQGLEVDRRIRALVRFRQGNLLDPQGLAGPFEVVFCRNVLIYFSRPLQERALARLRALLAPDGLLFVGHAEGGRIPRELFRPLRQGGAVAFEPAAEGLRRREDPTPPPLALPPPRRASRRPPSRARKRGPVPPPPRPPVPSPQEEAARLLEEGKAGEAEALCRRWLEAAPVEAEAHYLLGSALLAQGRRGEGEEALRRAVYLDPRHYRALVRLAAEAGARGDRRAEAAYRARAARVRKEEVGP